MVCKNCKRAIPDGSSSCPYCGAYTTSSGGFAYENVSRNQTAGYDYSEDNAGMRSGDAGYSGGNNGYQPQVVVFPQPVRYTAPPVESSRARTAQSTGVWGLCLYILGFNVIPLILSIIGIASAGQACRENGGRFSPSAKVGRVCGIIGTVFTLVRIFLVLLLFVGGIIFFGSITGFFEEIVEMVEEFVYEYLMIQPFFC